MTRNASVGLGTLLRRLQELTDGELETVYVEDGLDYLPRYTPVMRAIASGGARTVRELAQEAYVSHSAASQTVSRMVQAGLVKLSTGADARERHVQPTRKALSILPRLQTHWRTAEAAAQSLEKDIDAPLREILAAAIEALERHSFSERMRKASKT